MKKKQSNLSFPGVTCCGTPPAVQHATVSITNYNSIQIATYRCDAANGYATRGNNTMSEGFWLFIMESNQSELRK